MCDEEREFEEEIMAAIVKAKKSFYKHFEDGGYDPNVALEIRAKVISMDFKDVLEEIVVDNTGTYIERYGDKCGKESR